MRSGGKRNTLAWWLGTLAAMKTLASAGTLQGVMPERWAALALSLSAALDMGTVAYIANTKPVAEVTTSQPQEA